MLNITNALVGILSLNIMNNKKITFYKCQLMFDLVLEFIFQCSLASSKKVRVRTLKIHIGS